MNAMLSTLGSEPQDAKPDAKPGSIQAELAYLRQQVAALSHAVADHRGSIDGVLLPEMAQEKAGNGTAPEPMRTKVASEIRITADEVKAIAADILSLNRRIGI